MQIHWKNKRTICFAISLSLLLPAILLFPITSANNPPPSGFSLKWSSNLDEYYPIGWGPEVGDYCYTSNIPPVSADVISDNWQEIFLCIGYDHDIRNPPQLHDEGTIYAINPHTGVPFWTYHCNDFGSHTVLSLHDLDGDQDLELLAAGYHNITAFHAEDGAILWNKNYPNNREDKPPLVINENGNIWVYTCQNRYNTYEETIQKRWGSNGSIAQEADFPGPIHPCHGGLSCADINNDGELEIISVDRNYGANHQGLSCWTLNLEKLWSQPFIACSTSCGVLLDVNDDGYLDIVAETASDGLYIINGDDGTIQRSGTGLGFSSGEIYTPAIYDIDQDGRDEVIAANSGAAKVFDMGTWSMEATLYRWDGNNFYRSPVIANVYGDSRMEMVFGTYAGIQLISGTHGQYQTIALQDNIHTSSDRMLIQDIDNDGKNEIVALAHGTGYGYGSYNFVTCYDTQGVASPGTSSKDFLYSYRRMAVAENIPSYDPDSTPTSYTLSINTIGNGTITKNPNKAQYTNGEIVTITATANTGWVFDHWTGAFSGSTNPISITIDGNTAVTATFIPIEYTFTVTQVGFGSVTKSPEQATYHYGDVVTLTAAPQTGWAFTTWVGDLTGSTNPVSITIDGNNAVIATFAQSIYTFALTIIGEGTVTKVPDQTVYASGQVVTLTAIPASGYTFAGWSGALTGSTNPTTITMDANKTVTATYYTKSEYTFTINVAGSGTVTKSPEQTTYYYGDVVQLTAIPETECTFNGWSDDLSGNINPTTITISRNTIVTACFTTVNNQCTTPTQPSGPIVLTSDMMYTYRTNATDPDGDPIYYLWDWGDGTSSGWQGSYQSGSAIIAQHRWDDDGVYNLKVKAKDTKGNESEWSNTTTVYVTRPMYLFGLIHNLKTNGEISCFNADFVVSLRVNPLELHVYHSGEQFLYSKTYNGFIGPNGIIGQFNTITP